MAVGEGEECVSFGGRLTEALVCDDGCRGACEVSYRQDSLRGCVGACLLVGEDVPGGICCRLSGCIGRRRRERLSCCLGSCLSFVLCRRALLCR